MNISKVNSAHYDQEGAVDHLMTLDFLKRNEEAAIKKYFRGKILDLGCGSVRTTKILFERGFNVVGVDIGENLIKRAKEESPKIDYRVGDAANLKFKNNTFDVVFFSCNGLDYLYPLKERGKALREMARVLKPDGFMIYSSHNPYALFFRIRPKFLMRNIKSGTLFSRYKIEGDPFGVLYTQYAPPKKQIEEATKITGLRFIEKISEGVSDLHPYYVFQKSQARNR